MNVSAMIRRLPLVGVAAALAVAALAACSSDADPTVVECNDGSDNRCHSTGDHAAGLDPR